MTTAETPWDLASPRTAVLLQHRRVVSLGAWLHAALVEAHGAGRALAVVTPADGRLTLSTAQALRSFGGRWVVDVGGDLLDGFTGTRLAWDGEVFAEQPDAGPGLLPSEDPWALHVTATTVHPHDDIRVGALTTAMFGAAGLHRPEGYGVLEPLEHAYDVAGMTRLAEEYFPRTATITAAGQTGDALITARPTDEGVTETAEILAGATTPLDPRAVDGFLADALAAGAQTATLSYRRAAAGRYLAARRTGPVVPAALVVARRRLGDLDDRTLLGLGPGARLLDGPVPAWCVTYDADPAHLLAGAQASVQHRQLVAALTRAAGAILPESAL